jgi:transcription elongation factor Elf1
MTANLSKESKRPHGAERPFPWQCPHCGRKEVVMCTVSYDAEILHDARLYNFTVPKLEIPVCQACSEKVFTEKVDEQINSAFRSHLHLLALEKMPAASDQIDTTGSRLTV